MTLAHNSSTQTHGMAQDGADGSAVLRADDSPIIAALQKIHANHRNDFSGKLASYIPELANADPGLFGVALASADGQIYEVGDTRRRFTIQSI